MLSPTASAAAVYLLSKASGMHYSVTAMSNVFEYGYRQVATPPFGLVQHQYVP